VSAIGPAADYRRVSGRTAGVGALVRIKITTLGADTKIPGDFMVVDVGWHTMPQGCAADGRRAAAGCEGSGACVF
jgi:hypothetical protein